MVYFLGHYQGKISAYKTQTKLIYNIIKTMGQLGYHPIEYYK